jgi:ABC-type transport system involved in multi-copper enzyme maturation permease subunit
MNWSKVRATIRKDLKEVLGMKMVVMPMAVMPFIVCIILPGVLAYLAFTQDVAMINGAEMIEKILPYYPVPEVLTELAPKILYIFVNYSFLPMFMIIPVMVSSIITANSVVGEKERGTLETLLYSPLTNREFIAAKLFGSFLPGYLVTLVSFLLYFLTVNGFSLYYAQIMLLRSPVWIPGMLLLAPGLSLLGLAVTLMISLRAKSYMEAQQISALVVLPLVLLVILQISGLVIFHLLYTVLLGVVVLLIDYLLISKIAPRFDRENIISTL